MASSIENATIPDAALITHTNAGNSIEGSPNAGPP
jgi:hypothetical protein